MQHIIGSACSNSDDLIETVDLIDRNMLDTAIVVTHIEGLNCTTETVQNLPNIPGVKILFILKYLFR